MRSVLVSSNHSWTCDLSACIFCKLPWCWQGVAELGMWTTLLGKSSEQMDTTGLSHVITCYHRTSHRVQNGLKLHHFQTSGSYQYPGDPQLPIGSTCTLGFSLRLRHKLLRAAGHELVVTSITAWWLTHPSEKIWVTWDDDIPPKNGKIKYV